MRCPFCSKQDTYVTDSRNVEDGAVVRRRRLCNNCRGKFTTYERIQSHRLMVIKKSGLKKSFDREKISKSITAALRKQSISEERIDHIIDKVLLYIKSNNIMEISTRKIGELIMDELLRIDSIAYIRFASVYKDFTSAKDFSDFINHIQLKHD